MGSQYFLETPVLDLRPATTMFQRSYSSVGVTPPDFVSIFGTCVSQLFLVSVLLWLYGKTIVCCVFASWPKACARILTVSVPLCKSECLCDCACDCAYACACACACVTVCVFRALLCHTIVMFFRCVELQSGNGHLPHNSCVSVTMCWTVSILSQVAPFLADPGARIHAIWELFCRMPHLTEAKAKCALVRSYMASSPQYATI